MSPFLAAVAAQPILSGRYVQLEPATPAHVDALVAVVQDGQTYELPYLSAANAPHPSDMADWLAEALEKSAAQEQKIYVIRSRVSGAIVGSTRYYDLQESVPRLAIGYTFYAQSVRRTAINSESKLLLLRYAFENAGCECVNFHTSHLNAASRAAIARLGAKQDGILRADKRHRDGSMRDTVVFSILRSEWPGVRAGLIEKLQRFDPDYPGDSL